MRKVTLVFPDISSLTEFILSFRASKALIDSTEKQLTAVMSEKSLEVACKIYGAKIRESVAVTSF